ncbi:unnamed protein product [Ambrosiozyma monospora]|uniref:Unnamed protein product n=1 Tax=Ambrosiozyma monospora TaxID=43982 RepID=A0ACB5ST89_AMBMO|nr:unnamed protein product [Ambrosiozyma monospora]
MYSGPTSALNNSTSTNVNNKNYNTSAPNYNNNNSSSNYNYSGFRSTMSNLKKEEDGSTATTVQLDALHSNANSMNVNVSQHPKTINELTPLPSATSGSGFGSYQSSSNTQHGPHHLSQLPDFIPQGVHPLFNPETAAAQSSHPAVNYHDQYSEYVTTRPPAQSSYNDVNSSSSNTDFDSSRFLLQRHNISLPYHGHTHQHQQHQQQQQPQAHAQGQSQSQGQQPQGQNQGQGQIKHQHHNSQQQQQHSPLGTSPTNTLSNSVVSISGTNLSSTQDTTVGGDNDTYDDSQTTGAGEMRSNSNPLAVTTTSSKIPSQKSITNTNKYKKFKEKIIEGVQETIDKDISLADLAKYYKINSKSSLKERENFKNIFSIRCLMEIAYVTDTNERGTEVLRSSLYLIYHNLCNTLKVEPIGPSSIGKLIRITFPKVQTKRLGIRGQSKYHYTGIKLKDRYLKLVEQLDEGDSNLKLNSILITNLNLPKAALERDELSFADYQKSQSECKQYQTVSGLLPMNPDTETVFYALLASLLEKQNTRLGVQQLLLNNNNQNYGYPQNYLLELLLSNNFVIGLQRLVYKPEFKELRRMLTQLANDYEGTYSRELKQLEPDTIDYKQRTKLAKHFVDCLKSVVHVSEFTDELNYVLTTQTFKLLDDINSLKLEASIDEHLKAKLFKVTADESLFALISKLVNDFKNFLSTGDSAVMLPIEPTINLPMFQFIGSTSRGYPQVYRFTQYLFTIAASFRSYRLSYIFHTLDIISALVIKKVLKNPARSDNVKNWIIVFNYMKDWLQFFTESTYLKYLYYEQALVDEDDRNGVH